MLITKMKELRDAAHKKTSALYLLAGLAVITGIAVIYTAAYQSSHEKPNYLPAPVQSNAGAPETARRAVLQWMKENSAMPEHVLSKIYSVALSSVNPDLVLAVCLAESNFNPHVESERGAIGLMGIMPDIWMDELRRNGIVREQEDLYLISNNINAGVYVLQRYLAKTNNLREALSRYAGRDPEYAARVIRMLGEISRARQEEQQTLASLK